MMELLITWGVPSAVTGFLFWLIKKEINKNEAKREEREKNTEKLMLMIMNTSRSTNILAEATARAVQRIPDAKCNGDMTSALELSAKYQKEEKDFLINCGIKHIFDTE